MALFSYKTTEKPSQGLYKEKGSKFISFSFPVETEQEIKLRIDALKKEYHDARHHCFAWTLGPEGKAFRAFDDGEPNHSAGDPILGQIRSRGITNVLVVVVRYFGGTKLGVGGLILAYRLAANNALANANIIEKEIKTTFKIGFDYASTPEVMRLIKKFELRILHQNLSGECEIHFEVVERHKQHLLEKMDLLRSRGAKVNVIVEI
jgi:uncharacterized YigZ family protein